MRLNLPPQVDSDLAGLMAHESPAVSEAKLSIFRTLRSVSQAGSIKGYDDNLSSSNISSLTMPTFDAPSKVSDASTMSPLELSIPTMHAASSELYDADDSQSPDGCAPRETGSLQEGESESSVGADSVRPAEARRYIGLWRLARWSTRAEVKHDPPSSSGT
jgi:hypothetical protein